MIKDYTISFLIVLFFSIPVALYGQTRIVQGTVTKIEKQTKKPFNSIPVTLYDPTKHSRSDPSITDIYGTYYFYNVPEGMYKLEIWIYGVVNKKDRKNSAKTYDVTVNYDNATSISNRTVLKLDPVKVRL